jgi:threonine dehydrogenase-like Zn-dependent dehydrogenase
LLVCGVAGAAAVMTVRADFKMIDTTVLSASQPPILMALAASYSRMLATGENTFATRLTVFRQAVVFVIVGGYLGLLAVLLHH